MKEIETKLDVLADSLTRYVDIVDIVRLRVAEITEGCKESHTVNELNSLNSYLFTEAKEVLDNLKEVNKPTKPL